MFGFQRRNASKAECRICLQQSPLTSLISPCLCRGSIKYMHTRCLVQWARVRKRGQCEICRRSYKTDRKGYRPLESFCLWWTDREDRKYRPVTDLRKFLLTRNQFLLFLVLLVVILTVDPRLSDFRFRTPESDSVTSLLYAIAYAIVSATITNIIFRMVGTNWRRWHRWEKAKINIKFK